MDRIKLLFRKNAQPESIQEYLTKYPHKKMNGSDLEYVLQVGSSIDFFGELTKSQDYLELIKDASIYKE